MVDCFLIQKEGRKEDAHMDMPALTAAHVPKVFAKVQKKSAVARACRVAGGGDDIAKTTVRHLLRFGKLFGFAGFCKAKGGTLITLYL